MQKIITLVIAAAILYTLLQKTQSNNKAETKEVAVAETSSTSSTELSSTTSADGKTLNVTSPATGNFIEKTLSNVLVNVLKTEEGRLFFENILQPVDKPIAGTEGFKVNNADLIKSMFKIQENEAYSIESASCGHIVTVSYKITSLANELIEEQTLTFPLGSRPSIDALDTVIVGMKLKQTRTATIPAKYAYYNDRYKEKGINRDYVCKLEVTLLDIKPHNFVTSDLKIFDDEIAYKIPLMCGDQAICNAKIIKLSDGSVLYDSRALNKKIALRIGDMNYPMIISHALTGKIPTGTRSVIAKGANYKSLGLGSSVIFPKDQLPADEYFMLELNDFEVLVQP